MSPIPPIGSIAPIIGAIVGAILTALFYSWRTRVRPHYLVCEEIARTSLEVIEEAKEQTEIRYGGTSVEVLSLEKLRLFNHGTQVLKDAHFTVRFNPEVKIVGIRPLKILPAGEEGIILSGEEQPPKQNERKFHVHCLNPFKTYEQEVIMDLICDGEISEVSVLGTGPGWVVRFFSKEAKAQMGRQAGNRLTALLRIGVLIVGTGVLLVPLGFGVPRVARFMASPGSALGILLGFTLAGIVGFVANRILWVWGIGPLLESKDLLYKLVTGYPLRWLDGAKPPT